uniref:Uncharacterized protein n=1 Tax=Solanum tuberosum TaxID=4113 RepID=M1DB30_SOLTU
MHCKRKKSCIAEKSCIARERSHASRRSNALQKKIHASREKDSCIAGEGVMHRKRKIYSSQENQYRLHHFSLQKRHQENRQHITSTYFISLTSNEEYIEDYIANMRHKLYLLCVEPDGVDAKCSRRAIKC